MRRDCCGEAGRDDEESVDDMVVGHHIELSARMAVDDLERADECRLGFL